MMFRHGVLSVLFLSLVIGCASGWANTWAPDKKGDGWTTAKPDGWDMEKQPDMKNILDHLWESVQNGDFTVKDAWALMAQYKKMTMGDKWGDSPPKSGDSKMAGLWAEHEAAMGEKMKEMKELRHLSDVLIKSGASDKYTSVEWKKLMKHVMFSYENRQDPVIDMTEKSTMKISATFTAPALNLQLCGLTYTLPELHKTLPMEGEMVTSATNRVEPQVHITDLHGEPVHHGLYTMIWVNRGDTFRTAGTFETPFLLWMVTNIPGSDVSRGDVVKIYLPYTTTLLYQVFVYEQNDRIYDDFTLSDYVGEACVFHLRCFFRQAAFIEKYGLRQRAVGTFGLDMDIHTSQIVTIQGITNNIQECIYYLNIGLPTVFADRKVNTDDPIAIKKAFLEFTSEYMSHEAMQDEYAQYVLRGQYRALIKRLVHKRPLDALIPYYTEYLYDLGVWYKAHATSVHLCKVWFDLPEVNKKIWFDDNKWEDGERVQVWSSEIRNAPMVKYVEREEAINRIPGKKVPFKDRLFTLLIVERVDFGGEFDFVATPDTPYVNWMVINIKGGDIGTGNELVPYLAWPESTDQYIFLYQQHYEIVNIGMRIYTSSQCRAKNRCAFQQQRFRWDFNLDLVGAGRYDVKKDVYGHLYQVRRGNQTPNDACDAYLEAKKVAGEAASDDIM